MGEVMTHPLNDYEQKLKKKRRQSHNYEQKLREKRTQSHPSISSPIASNIICTLF